MTWIRQEDVQLSNQLSNVIKVMSINPRAMEAVRSLAQAVTFGASRLTRTQEEAIATVTSVANRCRY